MKKIYAIIFAVTLLAFSFTAYQGKASDVTTTEDLTESMDETTEEEKSLCVTIYTPNDNVDGLNETDVEVPELNEFVILYELVEAKVIKEGTQINHFEKITENGKEYLVFDFNEKMGELLNSYGSSGEYVTMASIANTFLKAYDADFFKFTINGEIFESGHIIYDEPIGFSGF